MAQTKMGTLNDETIKELCGRGELIVENYKESNVRQACYELRASNVYYDVTVSNRKIQVQEDSYILIKPKQLVVIITLEKLELKNHMLGRILTKGKLFSIGLLPVNTYADPGFDGKLGIVFSNLSNNYLKIKPTEAIAKIEFCQLEYPVNKPYTGQHGYGSEIWPIPTDMILTEDEIKNDTRIKSMPEEIEQSYGKNISIVLDRIIKYERKIIIASCVYFIFILLLISIMGANWLDNTITIAVGIGINIVTTLFMGFATSFKR